MTHFFGHVSSEDTPTFKQMLYFVVIVASLEDMKYENYSGIYLSSDTSNKRYLSTRRFGIIRSSAIARNFIDVRHFYQGGLIIAP